MTIIGQAYLSETGEIKKLIAEYHRSEGLPPNKERIAWAVRLQLRDTPGLLLVARDKDAIVGVALAVCTPSAELGRVMTVNDFFVRPEHRRKGVGRRLAKRLVDECKRMKIDEIGLEVFHDNKTAASFWRSIGFKQADRFLFRQKLRANRVNKSDALISQTGKRKLDGDWVRDRRD
jgi:GNAT superfamily N-acetyltransferase